MGTSLAFHYIFAAIGVGFPMLLVIVEGLWLRTRDRAYYEVARTEWLETRGLPYHVLESTGFAIPVLEAHCVYRSPARYGDELVVRVSPSAVDGLRLRFDYRTLRGSAEGELLAEGWTVHVCMDREGRPRRPSAEIRAILGGP